MILIGLLIIAIGAFCQSSCYVPINKIKSWSWESYWIVQGVFAWLILPFRARTPRRSGRPFADRAFTADQSFNIRMTILFGALREWEV